MRRLTRGTIREARNILTLTRARASGGGVLGSTSVPQPTAQNEMLIASATPAWTLLDAPTAEGQVPITGADPYTPGWTALTVSAISDLAYASPGLTLSTANAAGSADTVIRSDATILVFDATVPDIIQPDDAAAAGAAAVAARRDHTHGIVCAAPADPSVSLAASAEGSGTSFARADHAHQLDQAIAPTWSALHTFNLGMTFGGATGVNVITVPDNAAQAAHLVDAGGIEYLRIVSTDAQPEILFDGGGVDVDFRVRASGIGHALFVQGSDGYVGVGTIPAAPFHVHYEAMFGTGIKFSGTVPTPYVETPDNAAIALRLIDAGATEYLRIISTDAQPVVVFNEGGADVDHRWEASGQANALFIQGSTGNIGGKTNGPAADWHVVGSTVANKHLVHSSYRTQILEDTNLGLQLIGTDISTGMVHIILTGAPAAGDNKHWIVGHLGVTGSNRFSIGYKTSSADGFTPHDPTEHFIILPGGYVGLGTPAPGGSLTIAIPDVAMAAVPVIDTLTLGSASGDALPATYTRSGRNDYGFFFNNIAETVDTGQSVAGFYFNNILVDTTAFTSGNLFAIANAGSSKVVVDYLGNVNIQENSATVRLSGTFALSFVIPEPIVETVGQIRIPWDCTVTRVDGNTLGGTSCTLNIEERGTLGSAGTNILSSDMAADANGESVTSSFGNSSLVEGNHLAIDISAVSGAVDCVSITLTVTID